MKDYFNLKERTQHIIIMCTRENLKNLSSSSALTEEDKKCLTNAVKWLNKFDENIFGRFGDAYRRTVLSTMELNTLRLESRVASPKDCLTSCQSEDLIPLIEEFRTYKCMDCERCDWKDCAYYGTMIATGTVEPSGQEGCPFKL